MVGTRPRPRKCANMLQCIAMKMSTRTYTLAIEKYPDGYLAHFPALPGCHTWGGSYEEAVRNAEEALVGYLEALQKNGEDVPVANPPRTRTFLSA